MHKIHIEISSPIISSVKEKIEQPLKLFLLDLVFFLQSVEFQTDDNIFQVLWSCVSHRAILSIATGNTE